MKIYKDYSLDDFNFWGGAEDNVKYLNEDDFDDLKKRAEVNKK